MLADWQTNRWTKLIALPLAHVHGVIIIKCITVIMFTYNVGCADSPKVVGPYKIVTLPMISSGVSDKEKASQSHGMCTWYHNTCYSMWSSQCLIWPGFIWEFCRWIILSPLRGGEKSWYILCAHVLYIFPVNSGYNICQLSIVALFLSMYDE